MNISAEYSEAKSNGVLTLLKEDMITIANTSDQSSPFACSSSTGIEKRLKKIERAIELDYIST